MEPVGPGFPGTVPVLWVLKSSVLVSRKFGSGRKNFPDISKL